MVKKLKIKEVPFLILALIIFIAVAGKYHQAWVGDTYDSLVETRRVSNLKVRAELISSCSEDKVLIITPNGNLCRENASQTVWLEMFDKYPAVSDGKEIIYEFLDEGDIESADKMINGTFPIDRYDPIEMFFPTIWEEDPYSERYWRFMFYSLRETRHLLYAYKQTGEDKYKDMLITIIENFLDDGMTKSHSWDDDHAVAFRTMTLVNTWSKLREENALSTELSEKILRALQIHGNFLLSEDHYEAKYNHGISQASALLLLSVQFPDLPKADKWRTVAEKRINDGIQTNVDEDGSLVENSPYYHFYSLEKYWDISKYYSKNNLDISPEFQEKITKMISYATYVLQPNLKVPLLGASLDRQIGNNGAFFEIGKENPEFLYVLTNGKEGNQPDDLNKYYPTAGQVIMRSGWEKKTKFENKFKDQTQVIFDVGPYRTSHSDLDALSLNLYSNGKTLITDTGLYTYEDTDELRSYFHGTAGHNTVMVDGKDQRLGSPTSGEFEEGKGFTLHSAQHSLYPQTIHQRGIALLGHDFVVVVDRLFSNEDHDYEQLFHLFPDAKTENNNGKLIVKGETENKELTIHQLVGGGEINVEDGLCSLEYEITVSCPTVTTRKRAKDATFITLLEIGSKSGFKSAEVVEGEAVIVRTKGGTYKLNLNEMEVDFFASSKAKEREISNYPLDLVYENDNWALKGEGGDKLKLQTDDGKIVIAPKNIDGNPEFAKRPYSVAEIEGVDSYYSIDQKLYLDIPANRSPNSFRIYEQEDFLPILGYHHIINDDQVITSPTLEMHISDFEKQISYMTNSMGCRWFTISEIVEDYILKKEKIPRRACVINFDDGRKNHFTNGYPIFNKYGAVATFYIISDRAFGDKESYMNLADLDVLYLNGNEIGSHTVSASSLLSDGYDREGLMYQLEESKKMLEEQGYKVTTFAYPRGEQNATITDLTSKYYVAGRDTNKDNLWRDLRPITTGFDKDYLLHLHYFKPELLEPEDLQKVVGYNSWWQFEEGYRVDVDPNNNINVMSSYHPASFSYAAVELPNTGDKISNKFIVSKDDTYNIELFGTVNTNNSAQYADSSTVDVYVDGVLQLLENGDNIECSLYNKQYYCSHTVSSQLGKGPHVISVTAKVNNVKLDKFRMYRTITSQDFYKLNITEYEKVEPRQYPNNLELGFKKQNLPLDLLSNVFYKTINFFSL